MPGGAGLVLPTILICETGDMEREILGNCWLTLIGLGWYIVNFLIKFSVMSECDSECLIFYICILLSIFGSAIMITHLNFFDIVQEFS